MLITPERKVPKRSDASQNDHKSKGYPSKTSEASFTMQKADKIGFKSPCAAAFEIDFQKSDFSALIWIHKQAALGWPINKQPNQPDPNLLLAWKSHCLVFWMESLEARCLHPLQQRHQGRLVSKDPRLFRGHLHPEVLKLKGRFVSFSSHPGGI